MKRFMISAVIVAFMLSGVTYAATQLPWTKNIYSVSNVEDSSTTVSVFDDADNKCYVVLTSDLNHRNAAISCVKR